MISRGIATTDRAIENAKAFAQQAHRNDTMKLTGKSYYGEHVLEVYNILTDIYPERVALRKAGLGHDTLEDNPEEITYGKLVQKIGIKAASLVAQVTIAKIGTWEERKCSKVEIALGTWDPDVLRLILADKVSGVRDLRRNLMTLPKEKVYGGLSRGEDSQEWYFWTMASATHYRVIHSPDDRDRLLHESYVKELKIVFGEHSMYEAELGRVFLPPGCNKWPINKKIITVESGIIQTAPAAA